MFTLAILEPGHFHAALTLRERHALLREEVRVYARPGAELDAFLDLLRAFNARAERPTAWRPVVYAGEAPLQRLLDERAADAVVLAGRNDGKMAAIRALHEAGLAVLGDKPWVTGPACLPDLDAAADDGGALLMDLMTSRHELSARVLHKLLHTPDVLGELRVDAVEPAIELDTVHHLLKRVNDAPLRRPPWYFDVRVQGDGVVDVPTHQVDLVQAWLRGPPLEFARDVSQLSARRWSTAVPAPVFERITGVAAWPTELEPWLRGDVLHLPCNGEIAWRLRGVPVRVRSTWGLEEPPGSGDLHQAFLRGTRADVRVAHGAETGFRPRVSVHPRRGEGGVEAAVRAAVQRWQGELPGLSVRAEPGGALELSAPPDLHTSHETHFARVLDAFLRCLAGGERPAELLPELRCKYTLLATAAGAAREEG